MVASRRFNWGTVYLLTDIKGGVFVDEPAVCVGKKDSDMDCPNLCAVCGEPLGSSGYSSFCVCGPGGRFFDIMIGTGCIRERIREEEQDIYDRSPYTALREAISEFPKTGRWYGTFLHHCIAKPYVRNKKNAERWDNSIMGLPGVKYIMGIVDNLRDTGWHLDAEMRLECGNVDLLATHPEKGTIVYDWKSDLSFENHKAYQDQVNGYMTELCRAGYPKISGYILWVREERREEVPFYGLPSGEVVPLNRSVVPSLPIRCTLNVDLNGGEGLKKKFTEECHHRIYGDEVSFFIPSYDVCRPGYKLNYFEASPYRDGEHNQPIASWEIENGFWVNFICSKKRHSFNLTAYWTKTRPYNCVIALGKMIGGLIPEIVLNKESLIDENKQDYIELDVSDINRRLGNYTLIHARLIDLENNEPSMEWNSDQLIEGMTIRIPSIDYCDHFFLDIEKVPKPEMKKPEPNVKQIVKPIAPIVRNVEPVDVVPLIEALEHPLNPIETKQEDSAECHFTPGRIYVSGNKCYGIYKRKSSNKEHAVGMVDVAEVDSSGKKISDLTWRHIYTTGTGKEFIYGISDTKWKIYTKGVLVGIIPEGIERWG